MADHCLQMGPLSILTRPIRHPNHRLARRCKTTDPWDRSHLQLAAFFCRSPLVALHGYFQPLVERMPSASARALAAVQCHDLTELPRVGLDLLRSSHLCVQSRPAAVVAA
jgi:hypothetical protein